MGFDTPPCICLPELKYKCKCELPKTDKVRLLFAKKRIMGQILEILRMINQKISSSDLLDEEKVIGAKENWMFAAFIVDRCLLIVFAFYLFSIIMKFGVLLLRDSV